MTTTATITTTTAATRQRTPPPGPIVLQLRLPPGQHQAQPPQPQQPLNVTWDSGVVDNEHMNKRKSKKCCIFHKQRPFDESDSEDDDDSDGGWEIGENGVPVWVPGNSGDTHDHDCGGHCGGH